MHQRDLSQRGAGAKHRWEPFARGPRAVRCATELADPEDDDVGAPCPRGGQQDLFSCTLRLNVPDVGDDAQVIHGNFRYGTGIIWERPCR